MGARLPDVIVIGAPRSGTTTLSRWLRDHPEVAFSRRKEVEYFDRHHERGVPWYLAQLPDDPGERCVVEATPTYLSDPRVAARVARALPDARFVAVLREPVARAWSNYWFFVQLGLERRSWSTVVTEEPPDDPLGYLWRGRYAEQLARWDALVGPDRVHVLLFDDLTADAAAAYAGICAFAGIEVLPPPTQEGNTASVNPTRLPRSRRLQAWLQSPDASRLRSAAYRWNAQGREVPGLDPQERGRLAPLFRDDLDHLAARLGRELPPSWQVPPA